jgi:RNA polymerase sigma-70 factor (ECF subfamily)
MNTLSGIFDGLLVLQYRAGDTRALGMLVKRHHSRLCRHAYWYTRDPDLSKDIVQECWSLVIAKIGHLKDPNKFGSWAKTIVTRKSMDYLSAIQKEKQYISNRAMEISCVEKDEARYSEQQLELLKTAIKQLSADHQLILRLFYLEEHSLLEIGSIMELPVGTVKSRLFHAREKLKSLLK